jgi:hypothetical protein
MYVQYCAMEFRLTEIFRIRTIEAFKQRMAHYIIICVHDRYVKLLARISVTLNSINRTVPRDFRLPVFPFKLASPNWGLFRFFLSFMFTTGVIHAAGLI